jgi:hypothetical protein
VELTLRSTVGIPVGHASMPQNQTLLFDSTSLHPSIRETTLHTPLPPSPLSTDATFSPFGPSTFRDKSRRSSSPHSSSGSVRTSIRGPISSSHSAASGWSAAASFWPFADAFAARGAVHVPYLPAYVVDGFATRCWGEHAREAVIIPLKSEGSNAPSCLLVLGLNSRLPYGRGYRAWIDLVRLSLGALLTAVQGREADVTRAA